LKKLHLNLDNKSLALFLVFILFGFVFSLFVNNAYTGEQEIGGVKQNLATPPPKSSITSLGCNNTSSPLTISATVYDHGGSGISNITLYFYIFNSNTTFVNPFYGTPFGVDRAPPWEWIFTFPIGEGEYWFYTKAIDNGGRVEYEPDLDRPLIQAICNYSYQFPFILGIHPANNTLNVSTTNPIVIIFNAPMNVSSVENSISLTPSKRISRFEWNGNYTTLTVIPPSDLASYTNYTLTIDTSAMDMAGNSMGSSYSWSLTTGEIENINNYLDYWILMIIIVVVIGIVAMFIILRKKKNC
jgi:hypothetical protein